MDNFLKKFLVIFVKLLKEVFNFCKFFRVDSVFKGKYCRVIFWIFRDFNDFLRLLKL